MSKHSTSWLHLKDPFAGDSFQPALMPWWTHWSIVFAHKKPKLDDSDIAKMYKHRYRDVIPGIQYMGTTDALELYTFLYDGEHDYASKCVLSLNSVFRQRLKTPCRICVL